MPDPTTGALPILDGTNAVTAAQWNTHYLPLEDLSLVLIGTRADQTSTGYSPGYFNLQNLEIRNGYSGDPGTTRTYTANDGSTRAYATGSVCGIYIEKGDHITIKGSGIHGNNEGIFGAGQGDQRNLEELTLDSNYIYGNGTINNFSVHNTYLEGINTVYQFNKYGPLRAGANGSGMKDRGAGTVIRYNSIQGGGHLIDLVETSNYVATILTLPSYHTTYMYGNLFYNDAATGSVVPIHYGGDQGIPSNYRKGLLHFYNNTFVNVMDQSQVWRINLFQMDSGGESLDARDNILYFAPVTAGHAAPEIDLLTDVGVAYFGRNWVTRGWNTNRWPNPFTGHAAGTSNFINNVQNDPGFVNVAALDFHLSTLSPCIDQEDPLSSDEAPVLFQYADPASGKPRTINGAALDLGAREQGG